MSIYVGNLPYAATEADLDQTFTGYGTVKQVHRSADLETGQVRRFAFVEMVTEDRSMQVNKANFRGNRNKS